MDRSSKRVLTAFLVVGGLLAVLCIGGCIVWFQAPIEVERRVSFVVDSGKEAQVYIGGELVGRTPLVLGHEDLERLMEPYETQGWPPLAATSSGASSTRGYEEQEATIEPDPTSGREDFAWILRVIQGGETTTRALRYRVVDDEGKVLDMDFATGRNRSSFRSRVAEDTFHFGD